MQKQIAAVKQHVAFVKTKQHIQDHKNIYLAAGGGLVVGALVRGHTLPTAAIKTTTILPFKSTVTHNITQTTTLIRRGHPGNIIRCQETGEIFASQARAADVMGINAGNLSAHLSGRNPHISGFTFEKIGEAVAPPLAK